MPPDRGGPRGPLGAPGYEYFGGPRGGPLGPPMYPMRRCSDSPGPPLLRVSYYGRAEEREGYLGGIGDPRGPPPRVLQRRLPPEQLQQMQQMHAQQQQQYYADMRRFPPSGGWRRRRSCSSRGSNSSNSSCGADREGPPGGPLSGRGSFIDRERKVRHQSAAICVVVAAPVAGAGAAV
ncbi:uncharacterized protein EMH_0031340 [Eimeria mitis]|uniref:Uncharacterized protein n=1 Tax=Eimeria mitis TaxID=44415 RepID=U6JRF1_9EIME|nr:uncharacterized protein EMH_0031340 [Eimeria mitis]CDJ27386.1 hypothetical protein EMH_0031340 [Eimeria mitis]